jgi:hypothetical protein
MNRSPFLCLVLGLAGILFHSNMAMARHEMRDNSPLDRHLSRKDQSNALHGIIASAKKMQGPCYLMIDNDHTSFLNGKPIEGFDHFIKKLTRANPNLRVCLVSDRMAKEPKKLIEALEWFAKYHIKVDFFYANPGFEDTLNHKSDTFELLARKGNVLGFFENNKDTVRSLAGTAIRLANEDPACREHLRYCQILKIGDHSATADPTAWARENVNSLFWQVKGTTAGSIISIKDYRME